MPTVYTRATIAQPTWQASAALIDDGEARIEVAAVVDGLTVLHLPGLSMESAGTLVSELQAAIRRGELAESGDRRSLGAGPR